ncbi:MAG: hypothetical protein H6765_10775 [Candidatus Peribacteria bacterium]|nr:MAG: hypothetical protein H6765_10775 [Candidatus Peribacteria bacterium]
MPFGLQTGTVGMDWIIYVVIGLIVFLWVYCILRVAKDIASRTRHFGLQLLSILLILLLTPLLGLPIYFLIRPVRYNMDNYEIKRALMADAIMCVYCQQGNNASHEFCVYCGGKLKIHCKECKKAYAVSYEYCPFCGAPNIE